MILNSNKKMLLINLVVQHMSFTKNVQMLIEENDKRLLITINLHDSSQNKCTLCMMSKHNDYFKLAIRLASVLL